MRHLVAARPSPGQRHTLQDGELSTHDLETGQTAKRRLTSAHELRVTLQSVFGLKLPATPEIGAILARAVAPAGGD